MAIFLSKYKNLGVLLRPTVKQEVNGILRTKQKPIKINFRDGKFNTEWVEKMGIEWSPHKVEKELRNAPAFGVDFWQPEKPALKPEKLIEMSYRDMQGSDELDEATRECLIDARQLEKEKEEPRTTIIGLIEKKLESEYDITFKEE